MPKKKPRGPLPHELDEAIKMLDLVGPFDKTDFEIRKRNLLKKGVQLKNTRGWSWADYQQQTQEST